MWQPQTNVATAIAQVLQMASSHENQVQMQVRMKLQEFEQKLPDYNCYLAYILTQLPQEQSQVRATAGLLLKNNLRDFKQELQQMEYLKTCLLSCLSDQMPLVRSTAGIVITTIVSRLNDMRSWPQLMNALIQMLNSQDANAVDGAFGALTKICEDSGQLLTQSAQDALRQLIPLFIKYTSVSVSKLRVYALTCANQFIVHQSPIMLQDNLAAYIQALSQCSTDNEGDVRRLVCQAFVMLLDAHADFIMPQMQSIAQFMMHAMRDDDEQVALEACEFWLSFAEKEHLMPQLRQFLPALIPLLLQSMVYTEADIDVLDEEDDANVPDRAEDIKPRHHSAKTHGGQVKQSTVPGAEEGEIEDGDEADDDQSDDGEDEAYSEWNLRKCSAATLDCLSNQYGDEILPPLLPLLNQGLFHADWVHREAAILALGAISEGCGSGIEPHLPQLFPYMLRNLTDAKPLVRSITCWTLSRFCQFAVDSIQQDKTVFFEPLLNGMMQCMLDKNKRVQEAACSAMAILEESVNAELIPYLPHLLQVFVQAFKQYQSKNIYFLLDTIGTCAQQVGTAMSRVEYVQLLMPPLIERWNSLSDTDAALFPLLECLTSLSVSFGGHTQTFAQPVYERCIRLIKQTLTIQALHASNPTVDEADVDFMIVALDLISGIVQGLGDQVQVLIANVQPSLFDLVTHCINDQSSEVRQSAFALIGDLCGHAFPGLDPYLPRIMPVIIQQCSAPLIDDTSVSALNNASWAAGEIAIRWQDNMRQFVPMLFDRLAPILLKNQARTLQENVAISIGRLALVAPDVLAPRLADFAAQWCRALMLTRDNPEKVSAFRGFMRMVQLNPQALAQHFVPWCQCICGWRSLHDQELRQAFVATLQGVKSMHGDWWPDYYAKIMPGTVKDRLLQQYNFQ